MLVLKFGDIELNPRLNKKSNSYFSFCHWNINSLLSDSCCIGVTLKTSSSTYKYDFCMF